jgi:NAD(P)-dependent dehydrogenase (short-subunit alcohol dehydrogenase family)
MHKNVLLITGGAKRIGAQLALDHARRGWDVVLHTHISMMQAAALQRQIIDLGRRAWVVQADLAEQGAGAILMEEALALAGAVDALIHNAAHFSPDTFATHTEESWQQHQQVNVIAAKDLTQALYRHHLQRGTQGSVVYIMDYIVAAPVPPSFFSYVASKRALRLLTEELAVHTAPTLRVNGVAPGPVHPGERESQQHFDGIATANPLQYQVTAEDLCQAIAFLISQPAVTGQILYVDGGKRLTAEVYT